MSQPREVRAPRGTELSAKSWQTEAPLRMLMNNLDPEVAERPEDLVVYGGTGRAARSWEAFDAIVESLKDLESDETLLVQSGKPVGVVGAAWLASRRAEVAAATDVAAVPTAGPCRRRRRAPTATHRTPAHAARPPLTRTLGSLNE